MLKRSKNIFLIFGTRQGLTLVLRIPIQNEKSGLHCSLKDIWKTIEKNDLISWKWTWKRLAMLLCISQWKIKDHVILKKNDLEDLENYLENDLIFWRWTWQWLTLLLRISQWRIKDHVVLNKDFYLKMLIFFILYFLVFLNYLKICIKRRERSDKH